MKRILSVTLCIIVLLSFAVSADSGKTVLMQTGSSQALADGTTISLTNSAGISTPLYCNIGGTPMIPLYSLAELFDFKLTWNPYTKQTAISAWKNEIRVSSGSSTITINGVNRELSCAVAVYDGSTFVPTDLISHVPGLYCHVYSPDDGSFVLISTTPKVIYDSEELSSYKSMGLRVLGPSKLDITSLSAAYRVNSMYCLAGGQQLEIRSDGRTAAPYCTSEGYMMIPLEFALKNSGVNVKNYAKYSDSCDFTIGSSNYSVYFGEHFLLCGRHEYSEKYYCELRSGTVYVSASLFTRITGLSETFTKSPVGVVFSAYSGFASMAEHCREMVSSLPDKRSNAEAYVALTFDDGPSGALTERLLDGLMERGARATFFLCDYRISSFSGVMDRYIAEGHEVANHSATHAQLSSLKGDSLALEIDSTNISITQLAGKYPTLLRPPGGAYNDRVLKALSDRNMSCILWSVDPMDWKYLDTKKVVNSIVSSASDGDIILLHDLYSTSVDAALEVIDILSERGFAFVTVSELAEIKGYDLSAGGVYYSFK